MGFFDVILKGLGFEVEDKPKKEKKEKLNKNKKIGEFDLQQIQNSNNQNNDLLLENNDLKNEQENNELFKNTANEEGKYLDKNLINNKINNKEFDDSDLNHKQINEDYEEVNKLDNSGLNLSKNKVNNDIEQKFIENRSKNFLNIKPLSQGQVLATIDELKKGSNIIIDVSAFENEDIVRVLDFISGACYCLGVQINKIDESTFGLYH